MDSDNQKPVISDVAHPPQEPEAQPQPLSSDAQSLDTRTQSPVVASKDNSNLKMTIIIVLAVVVALVLIGVAYMAFMQQEVEAPAQNDAQSQAQEPAEVDKVDSATIDQETAGIDAITNELDEATDFPEGEIDDTTLGL